VALALPVRIYLHLRTHRSLQALTPASGRLIFTLPFGEFLADVFLWLLLTTALGLVHYHIYGFSYTYSGIKLTAGGLVAGVMVGMLNFFHAEGEAISAVKERKIPGEARVELAFSVSRKVTFLMIFIMIFLSLIFFLMVYKDIVFLSTHGDTPSSEVLGSVLLEIVFVLAVMLSFGVLIIKSFSHNIKSLFDLQMEVMDRVEEGRLDQYVPVASLDEFGVIAARTNRMIGGLKDRQFVRETFGKYVSPEISERILKGDVPLDGEMREVTVLFCDLRGFTTWVEADPPREVVQTLNQYFGELSAAIKENHGLVLQFIGDEIEAVFGAPIARDDHPRLAALAALEMRERLTRLNRLWDEQGRARLRHGIGIHSGQVLAGNIGSEERMSYALVGDTVNIAARLQEMTKDFSWDILVTDDCAERLGGEFTLERLAPVTFRGKRGTKVIYKLIERTNENAGGTADPEGSAFSTSNDTIHPETNEESTDDE